MFSWLIIGSGLYLIKRVL
ncbi:sortase B protein-sorting domain-containing protein [Pedobacter alluvionis]|uniref:Sortase B protein-sorting domain-containing protein n=1 Tax=Pedobacter alluvionis TaxID=475253 RepID=A0ABY2HYV5_9SPHI|nr:sortase B protein-sorting domain-containing protein [Pedobacter alluvionis]